MASILKTAKKTIKNWWLFVLMGALLVIGGIYVMVTPMESYVGLAIFFSVMIFFNGLLDAAFAISNQKILRGWGWYLAGGILEIILGIVLMMYPGVTMASLPLILGFWLMYGAISIISGAFDLKSYHVKGWGWALALGILVLVFSVLVIAKPVFGVGTIVIMTSLAIVSYGLAYIAFGMQLKSVKDTASDFKDALKNGVEDLKNEVIKAIKEAEDAAASETLVDQKFTEFSDSIDDKPN